MKFKEASCALVPVDLWLEQERFHPKPEVWELKAGCYRPAKGLVCDEEFEESGTLEEMQALIERYVLPLYRVAVDQLSAITRSSRGGRLYYWELEGGRDDERRL